MAAPMDPFARFLQAGRPLIEPPPAFVESAKRARRSSLRRWHMIRPIAAALVALLLAGPVLAQSAPGQAGVDALIAADRAFSAAAARAPSPAQGIAAMLDADAVMPLPGLAFARGRAAVAAAFRDSPAFAAGRADWTPIRGGISADGSQGFTFGYLSLSAGDPARRERKYLAYWIRRPAGWRVLAYRQRVRQPGAVSLALLPASLPGLTAAPRANPAIIAAHRASLAAAERAFSDRAQQIGLRAAFREFGREDAMNMSESARFAIGLDAITAHFPASETASPVRWATERSFVAASGDLGVSIGTIRANRPAAEGRPDEFPFFTIWRRDRLDAPWRYIAE
jgi:ketosteroid isomerase-like protein